jgi:hypothetical protein
MKNDNRFLTNFRQHWRSLTQGAVLILSVIGSFLVPPPAGVTGGDGKVWLRLAQFVMAVLLGLMTVVTYKQRQRKFAGRWAAAAVAFLILAVGAFFGYQYLTSRYTCQYYEQTIVVGSVYTQQGQYYVGQNPGITCEGLLEDFVGKAEDVWTKESITRCLFLLAGTYLSCVPLFGFCVMSLVQALYCASIKKA